MLENNEQLVNSAKKAMDERANDDAVGFGKPPHQTRFQKGQSGNPGGKRGGTKTLATLLGEALVAALTSAGT